jgi:hypothetical protein
MNIHALTFEQLLEICASLEDAVEMKRMVEALNLLEKNVRYLRQRLVGRLQEGESREAEAKEKEKQIRKKNLRLVGPGPGRKRK